MDGTPTRPPPAVLVQPPERHDEGRRHGHRLQQQKGDEVAVISFPDAVAHPRAVVVEAMHALVGDAAVLGAPARKGVVVVVIVSLPAPARSLLFRLLVIRLALE